MLWGVWVPGVVCGRSRVGLVGWLDSGWRAREAGATCLLLKEGPQVHNTPLCSLDKYAVRFIPRENGIYLIDVKFNGTHIPGSPFKIRVGEPGHGGDPGLVSAYGAGLEGGITGRSVGIASSMWTQLLGPFL